MRYRAGVVIYCKSNKSILLIHRKKGGKDYWVVPGGGLEADESYEDAAKREIMEELGISIREMRELCTINLVDRIEKYFISYTKNSSLVNIQGEELKRSNDENIYVPTWIDISNIPLITLLPNELKNTLLEILLTEN